MNAKQALTTAAAICMICLAVLLTQTVFSGLANATPSNGQNPNSLKQRVMNLEIKQEENDKEFFMIDTGLSDLDMRVLDLEKRGSVGESRVNELEKRLSTMRATMRADNRTIFSNLREIRKDIRALQEDD